MFDYPSLGSLKSRRGVASTTFARESHEAIINLLALFHSRGSEFRVLSANRHFRLRMSRIYIRDHWMNWSCFAMSGGYEVLR
jgi:hypothetical protein